MQEDGVIAGSTNLQGIISGDEALERLVRTDMSISAAHVDCRIAPIVSSRSHLVPAILL